ncbi:HEPN domain-containing protein [Gynuella sp.]|uniref:HEPN domain-containing protein n=1 Tax=Gynuella sp. TaxID=2969146 RepID=UPI003D09F9DC
MKTTLDHLPLDKQEQLLHAVDVIVQAVKPELLILFGSYARGDWVDHLEDDGVHYRYQSDMDLLAITKNSVLAKRMESKRSLSNRLMREVKTPVSLIAEDIHFVNAQLNKGQYFYADIYREGILLHDSGKLSLVEPKELPLAARKIEAQRHFDHWLKAAQNDFKMYQYAVEGELPNNAAFSLHQVTERLFSMILLVFTHYKPKIHDLEKLRTLTGSIEPEFLSAFPESTPFECSCFELLCQAYVDSRYDPGYSITTEQLEWLAERIRHLQTLAEKHCAAKIESLG